MVVIDENSPQRVLGGRYQLGARLGTPGRSSTVFEALDLHLERAVAVKLLDPNAVATPDLLARFRAAAHELTTLSHPNIVAVYDFGQEEIGGVLRPYLVMELLTGGSMRAILDRGRTLSPSQALMIGLDACRGLDHAHRRGIVHGDVKPSNLLFGEDRRLRIADLGISRLVAHATGATAASLDLGSARYASPEQAQDKRIDGKSDVYSLALILTESVTGQLPFAADTTVATLANRVDHLLPVSADLGALAAVLERAGRPNPAERSSASEFGRALVQAAQQLPKPQPLSLVIEGTSLFDAPPGQETTTELTRFADATGGILRDPSGAIQRDPSGAIARDSSGVFSLDSSDAISRDPSRSIRRDPTGAVLRDPSGAIIRDTTGSLPRSKRSGDSTGGLTRPRVVGVDEQGRAQSITPTVSRRPVITYLLLALGMVLAGVLGVVAYRKLTVPSFAVPSLVGIDEGQATNEISANDWKIEIRRELNDEQELGKVIRTDPAAGVKLKRGSVFVMVVSDGPTLSTLPELTGQQVDQAKALLTAVGLTGITAEEQFDESIPPGQVISWKIAASPGLIAGSQVVKGTAVNLYVSKGPAPRGIKDLTGITFADAKVFLEAQGLLVTQTGEDFSDTVPAGQIMAQSIPDGTSVERGTTIEVTVSKGPDVVPVPNLGGLGFDAAKAAIEANGLTVGTFTGNFLSGTLIGTTFGGANVDAGQLIKRGSALDLTFSP